ncbi:MAG TPA: class I SAM-dependent methyltransferase [Solirubrobacterales bacterium]|nr:class I SAM-dependent methyltransferase [Solirubrobacterales bacterium]
MSEGSGAISPTAHYTGETWVRSGLSHPGLRTWQGRVFHGALALPLATSRSLGGPTLEGLLLARHRIIDSILEEQIENGVSQVVEAACGMSPRGWRFSERYGDRLTYVEADLPAMARRKREALERMGSLSDNHRVEDVDLLRDGGPGSLEALTADLDPARGLAIVTEGLLTYLDEETVEALWARLATVLGRFERGVYLADLRLEDDNRGLFERTFSVALGAFVRGRLHPYPGDEAGTEATLRRAGFEGVRLHRCDEHPAAAEAGTDPAAAAIHILAAET